ncbi:MAG TPA: TonB family protein [Methylophilaceae bacterium]
MDTQSDAVKATQSYFDDCIQKILDISKSDYPAEINGMHGRLVIKIDILPDGQLRSASLTQSTGYKRLDDAIVKFVHSASPFKPLPEDILKTTDVLTIRSTFVFTPENSLKGFYSPQ